MLNRIPSAQRKSMKIEYLMRHLFFLIVSLLLLTSCKQESQPKQEHVTPPEPTKHYSNNGLSLNYPSSWVLVSDETPSLYADRGVVFDISESSRASVLVYKDRVMTASDIADQFVREQRLNSGKQAKNFHLERVKISGFEGVRLSWQDTMVMAISVEVTILAIADSHTSVYAVYQFFNEDIASQSDHLVSFAKSISIH